MLLFIVLITVANGLAEQVVSPIITGKGLQMSATLVFLSFMLWGGILGGSPFDDGPHHGAAQNGIEWSRTHASGVGHDQAGHRPELDVGAAKSLGEQLVDAGAWRIRERVEGVHRGSGNRSQSV